MSHGEGTLVVMSSEAMVHPSDVSGDVLLRVDDDQPVDALSVLRPRLRAHAAAGGRVAVVDVTGLSRVSSSTLTGLLVTKRRCRALGVRLEVRGVAAAIHPVLYRAGLVDDPVGGGR